MFHNFSRSLAELAGGEDEVPTDPSEADLDTGGLDGGLDIDTLVDPGSGQNA